MQLDTNKIDDAVLALLYLGLHDGAQVVGTLTHQVAQRLRLLVGLENRWQQAVLVQALDPLASAFVGFGSALDLAGERRCRGDNVEAGFEERPGAPSDSDGT